MSSVSMEYVIALYVRLSIEDSKVDSLSIQSQLALLHSYADDMEIPHAWVEEFIDNGHSGTNFERPAVQELLDRVRAGEIHCILVKDFSRFGRNMIEVGYFMERVFPVFGVRFISVEDAFDSAQHQGDTGGIGMAVKYLISEFYSRDMSVKTRTAKYVKMKRGEYQSVVCPYGYQKGVDGRMEIDEETAPNVRLIFQMALDGHDAHQIAEELFQKGVITPGEFKASKGKHYHDVSRCRGIWQRTTILRILSDERYAGTYVMGKRKVREIGTRKALGATNANIQMQFVVESALICLVGGVIGIILGAAFGYLGSTLLGVPTLPDLGSVALAAGFSLAVGIFFGYYPASKAAKMDPIEALRYE